MLENNNDERENQCKALKEVAELSENDDFVNQPLKTHEETVEYNKPLRNLVKVANDSNMKSYDEVNLKKEEINKIDKNVKYSHTIAKKHKGKFKKKNKKIKK